MNKTKHGIDFEEAQKLWTERQGQTLAITLSPANTVEERFTVTGKLDGKYWTAIITFREAAIRIISVRRARKNERKNYDDLNA